MFSGFQRGLTHRGSRKAGGHHVWSTTAGDADTAVVFVHGCYWHRHQGCRYAYTPKTRIKFWTQKFESNVERDRRNLTDLQSLGWRVIVVWECELREMDALQVRLKAALSEK